MTTTAPSPRIEGARRARTTRALGYVVLVELVSLVAIRAERRFRVAL